MRLILLTFFLVIGLCMYTPVSAQLLPAPVSMVVSPPAPSPGDTVTVAAVTPSFDSHTAYFSWTVDGRARADLSGTGKNTITLIAGNVGSTQRAAVSVSRKTAGTGVTGGDASITIRPAGLILTYVAETFVPRWYRGKALPVSGSIVEVIALPDVVVDGTRVPAERLMYRWGLDDERNVLTGIGEQVLRVQTSDMAGTSHEVKVRVEDEAGKVKKEGVFYIVPATPLVAIYNSSPLGGVEFRTSQNFTGTKGLFDFIAEPFFFPVPSRAELAWRWNVGGAAFAGNAGTPHIITVDTGQYPEGPLSIGASAEKSGQLFLSTASALLTFFLR